MNCQKCGSQNIQVISETSGKIKKRGCLMSLFHITMVVLTLGLWIIIPIIIGGSKGKIKSRAKAICLNCSNSWYI